MEVKEFSGTLLSAGFSVPISQFSVKSLDFEETPLSLKVEWDRNLPYLPELCSATTG